MFILYDANHNKIGALTDYKDYHEEQAINSDDLLHFSYPVTGLNYSLLNLECYISNGSNEYVVKEINVQNGDWTEVVCKIDLEDLKGKTVSSFESVEQLPENMASLALVGTGWAVGFCDVTKLRTVRKAQCSVYDVLVEISKAFLCEITYNSIFKTVNIHMKQGADRGTYFAEQLNLKSLQVQSNTNEYVTRLIPIGKDGLGIASVNAGVNYVSNYQYSNKVITGYWIDNRYTDAQSLMNDAKERLEYSSKPTRAYDASIIDFASVSTEWGILDFTLGDFITLLSESKNIRELQRVVKIDRYPDEPERSTIQIANKIPSLVDIILHVVEASDVVNGMTDTTGAVVASGVVGDLTRASIPMLNVGDLSATVASIGSLIATKASITALDAISVTIDDLIATVITTTDLTATNARIQVLETDSATIDMLSASEAAIGLLIATKATIDDLIATNLSVTNLTATSATVTQLNATNGNITSLTSTVATINTLLAGNIGAANLAAGAIQAGSAVIAVGAIGSAQISDLSATKITAGMINTAVVTIQGANARLKITGNRLQVFAGVTPYERISLGDVNGDGTVYGFRVRGADGTTILYDETGVKREGVTDGSINNAKIGSDANISGTKLDIASVVTSINGGVTTIQSSKIFVNGSTLDVQFSSLNTAVTNQGTTITSQGSSITALNNSIVLKASQTSLDTTNSNVTGITTRVTTAEASIVTQAGQITLKASQTSLNTTNGNVTTAQTQANLGVTNAATAQTAADLANTNATALTTRVTTAEASIVTQAGQITSKVTQTQVDTSISVKDFGSTMKVFNNTTAFNGSGGSTGAIVIETPITLSSYMTSIDISGYVYDGVQCKIAVSIGFYAYIPGNPFINYGYISTGSFDIVKVQLALNSLNKVVIILGDITSVWQYPKVQVDKASISFTTPPESFKDGWTISLKTSLTSYTSVTNVVNKKLIENTVGSQTKVDLFNTNTVVPLTTRVTTAETTIVQNTNSIALKASQTSLDTTNGNVTGVTTRMTTAESALTIQAGQISTKVDVAGVKSTIQQSATDVQIAFNAINAAKVTFDATGLVVDGGSYYIVEPGTQKLKTTVYSLPNLLADASFEGILNYDINPADIIGMPPNLTYYDYNPELHGNWFGWNTYVWSGSAETTKMAPHWDTSSHTFEKKEASSGQSMAVVNSTNHYSQGVDLAPSQTYYLSASHCQKIGASWRSIAASKLRLEVAWSNGWTETGVVVTQDFVSTTAWQRSGFLITVPATGVDGARIRIKSPDANWIYVDGVQLVQGSVPGKFEPNDDLWSHINGETGFNTGVTTALGGYVNVAKKFAFKWEGAIPINGVVSIVHNLGYVPIVQTNNWNGNNTIILSITHDNVNQLRLFAYSTINQQFSGDVRLY